jgi:molybdopterin-containing oxidoreductase family iron-sulfur binding subunit
MSLLDRIKNTRGREYWKSLEELADTPEFRAHVEKEFPSAAEQMSDPVSRRSFLQLMGAAVALSGVVGCRRPLAKILPYAKMPEDLLPGIAQYYATVMPFQGGAEGLLVESHTGRPTKIEGNPGHPASLGATHGITQASILGLYDPDRSQAPTEQGRRRSWDEFATWALPLFREARGRGGRGLAFLSETTVSPSLAALRNEVRREFPRARWVEYDAVSRENAVEGSRIAFGRPLRTQLRLEQADVIFALDCDFLLTEPNSVRHARDFSKRRRVSSSRDGMNRLYAAESTFSVTGSMADHRLRLPCGQIPVLARFLSAELAREHGLDLPPVTEGGTLTEEQKAWVQVAARDLARHRGRCVVVVGNQQPAAVHAIVHQLNEALGSVGPVVRYTEEPAPTGGREALADLAAAMERGEIETLVVLEGNPAYDGPVDLDLGARIGKVAHTVRLGLYEDETSEVCTWHLPLAHYLESWGDARAWDGTVSVQQPLIAPLYEGRSERELLSLLLELPVQDGYEGVRSYFREMWGEAGFENAWSRALHDGLVAGSSFPEVAARPDAGSVTRALSRVEIAPPPGPNALEVVFRPDPWIWDGRFANNAWLQELPDQMSKITWDNPAFLSPATADELGVTSEDRVRLQVGDRELSLPVWVAPGLADHTVVLHLGYGRRRAGKVGTGVGFDTYAVRAGHAMSMATGATLTAEGGRYPLVSTQDTFSLQGRPLFREGTLEEYREHPDFVEEAVEVPPLVSLYSDREYDYDEGYQWGMAIDLNTCIGCNACAVACQSENNVVTVGKDQVQRGRIMHWIRIDRYYEGTPENAQAVHQPVNCMHCENAPCENVCPVNATSHSSEGLNQMTYNRCIGTRYCNNNCPYKVRRFNYFNWHKDMTPVEELLQNPNVTVRMRGVMEKCTYCVQRINRAKIDAKNQGREVRDGEIRTACQQVCPTESIVFGNVNDAGSEVTGWKSQDRNYAMLAELNTRPRTTYLAKIRNPNPELEDA